MAALALCVVVMVFSHHEKIEGVDNCKFKNYFCNYLLFIKFWDIDFLGSDEIQFIFLSTSYTFPVVKFATNDGHHMFHQRLKSWNLFQD